MKKLRFTIFLALLAIFCPTNAQRYIQADPFNLMYQEKAYFRDGEDYGPLLLRPLFKPWHNPGSNWTVTVRGELFNNTGAPNLENTAERWIGKGQSKFTGVNISYSGKFFTFSLEPFYFENDNKNYPELLRIDKFTKLNDTRIDTVMPYIASGIREAQVYLHYRGVGVGFSNASMWWGPGIHSSLNMTNNTTGFKHLMVGTLQEKRIRNVSFNVRYIFSEMDSLNVSEPYYTAFLFSATLHSDPVLTVGLSRTYLSGGNRTNETITKKEAMLLPFEALYLESKQTDPDDPTSSLDIWDQTLVGYLVASFPRSGLKIFVEYGRNDHAWNKKDFRKQPDHTAGSVIGLRKYGLFGFDNLTGGIEYANLIRYRYWHLRGGADWYDRWNYDFSSYDGRHWGAHSGPDSDDFTIYLGYLGDKFSIIPSFNYERHGIIYNPALVWEEWEYLVYDPETGMWFPQKKTVRRKKQVNIFPEVKFEMRLDIRFVFKNFRFNLYYEREFVDNLEFRGQERRGKVLWFGVERSFQEFRLPSFLKKRS